VIGPSLGRHDQLARHNAPQGESQVDEEHGERQSGGDSADSDLRREFSKEDALIAGFAEPQPVRLELDTSRKQP
jgi:hypothetical protein